MSLNSNRISDLWKKEYCEQISKYSEFKTSELLENFAAVFAPGRSYFYILNMHDLELDYISREVEDFTGLPPGEVSMQDLLKMAVPEEIERIEKKEVVIRDFYIRHLKPEEITSYKLVYTYQMKDPQGVIRTILHQATPLAIAENGTPQHILSVHSDISHLKVSSSRFVSFINLRGGESYYNIDPAKGYFSPSLGDHSSEDLSDRLTTREKEIIRLFARGYSANQIAEELVLSSHTIATHRKNILQKSGCSNTVELVAKCLTGGVVEFQDI